MLLLLAIAALSNAAVSEARSFPSVSLFQLDRRRAQLVAAEAYGLNFEVFVPRAWSKADKGSWPVLVFLHGRGESGGFDVTNAQSLPLQLLNNASFAASFPFITLIPQCPRQCARSNVWLPSTLNRVTRLVEEWAVPILRGDASRVYLTGQSMGGHGAWKYAAETAAREHRVFAALVVVCGYANDKEEERAFSERLAKARMPVMVVHSADDSVIPVAASDSMVQQLRRRGYAEEASGRSDAPVLAYTRYEHAPGPPMPEFAHLTGHGSYELAFRDEAVYKWLLRRACAGCGRPKDTKEHALPGFDTTPGIPDREEQT